MKFVTVVIMHKNESTIGKMNIIVIDDEKMALEQLSDVVKEVFTEKQYEIELYKFHKWTELRDFLNEKKKEDFEINYAFLDIHIRGKLGIEIAKSIKEICPKVKIIFVTAYSEYACEAFQLHALGYILKPVTREAVEDVLDHLDVGWQNRKSQKRIKVRTFGNFDIFVDDEVVTFERSKAKELLAYLIDKKGTGSTIAEISSVLWEDKEYNKATRNLIQKVISSMMKALKQAQADNIIEKRWNYIAVKTNEFECDYYDFINEDGIAVNSYTGEYMNNYSWAEFTSAMLQQKIIEN